MTRAHRAWHERVEVPGCLSRWPARDIGWFSRQRLYRTADASSFAVSIRSAISRQNFASRPEGGRSRRSAIVKGCLMPALIRRCAMRRRCSRGRRRTSLEGGNRGMHRRSGRGAGQLWGFDCWQSSRKWQLGQGNVLDVDGMCSGVVAIADCLLTRRCRRHARAAQGKAVRYRCQSMKSGGTVRATESDHAATRGIGGARIGCPRAKVSMMSIAAPQSRQTKRG